MALMTKMDYLESLRRMRRRVYTLRQEIGDYAGHPLVRPCISPLCQQSWAALSAASSLACPLRQDYERGGAREG